MIIFIHSALHISDLRVYIQTGFERGALNFLAYHLLCCSFFFWGAAFYLTDKLLKVGRREKKKTCRFALSEFDRVSSDKLIALSRH